MKSVFLSGVLNEEVYVDCKTPNFWRILTRYVLKGKWANIPYKLGPKYDMQCKSHDQKDNELIRQE